MKPKKKMRAEIEDGTLSSLAQLVNKFRKQTPTRGHFDVTRLHLRAKTIQKLKGKGLEGRLRVNK